MKTATFHLRVRTACPLVIGSVFLWLSIATTAAATFYYIDSQDAHGLNTDPQVIGPLGADSLAYKLRLGSPAIDYGRGVTDALRGMGLQDAAGVPTPQNLLYDIGAFEYDFR